MTASTDDVEWLIAREIPRVRRYALALVRDPDRADDLVQDCLERAIRKKRQWTGKGSLRAWLYRITYTTFLNQLPRRNRDAAATPIEDVPEAGAAAPVQDHRMAVHDVMDALGRLPAEQRAAIVLVAVEGLSYTEAATVLGVRVGTLRSRLSRGREALGPLQRSEFAPHQPAPGVVPEVPGEARTASGVTLRRVK